ncbi:MAG: DMT family transporter [Minwuia sp.]|uniref:DMT family transporter n=1 Tax=Minwuia sp. TaxID=2493630 RepID=UPI003A8AD7CF
MSSQPSRPSAHATTDTAALGIGVALGLTTALIWSAYMILVRHGVTSGFAPIDMAAARYWPAGLIMLPVLLRVGIRDLGGIGWGRGLVLTIFAGPPFALFMSFGLNLTPISHGGVIAPSSLTLITTLLAVIFIGERLSRLRLIGLVLILSGVVMVAGLSFLATFNTDVLLGDLLIVGAPACWAVFTLLLRVWQIDPLRGTAVTVVLGSLGLIPFHIAFSDYGALMQMGWGEIGIQLLGQGVMNGFLATLMFVVTVSKIGPARAAVFPSLVPGFTILMGAPILGEIPTLYQFAGLASVTVGLVLGVGLMDEWLGWRRRKRAALAPTDDPEAAASRPF